MTERQVIRVGQMFNYQYPFDSGVKLHLVIKVELVYGGTVELTTLWNGARWIWRQQEVLRLQSEGNLQVF